MGNLVEKIFVSISAILGFGMAFAMFGGIFTLFWKPDFQSVKKYIQANDIGSQVYKNDSIAEFCQKKNWFSREYYLKSKGQGKMYYVGYGVCWMKKVSNDRIKEVSYQTETDECEPIKW